MWQQALSLLKLGDASVSVTQSAREQAQWVAAYYQTSDKAVTVIDRGTAMDTREAVALLVHEATHALQDQSVGLGAFQERVGRDLDRVLASKAVTEGEASLMEDLAALGLFGAAEDDVRWGEVFATWQDYARQGALESGQPVSLAWGHFPYPFGTPYVHAAYRAGGRAGLDDLYQAPPASAAQVLAGFGAPAAGGLPWAEELGTDAVPKLPAPHVHVDGDRLGAWVFSVFWSIGCSPPLPRRRPEVISTRLARCCGPIASASCAIPGPGSWWCAGACASRRRRWPSGWRRRWRIPGGRSPHPTGTSSCWPAPTFPSPV